MKLKMSKKIIAIIIVLMVGMSVFATYSAFTSATQETQQYPLSVEFEQNASNEKEFAVKLRMSDEDSVASFQIGLDVNVDQSVNPKFEFDQGLLSKAKYNNVNSDTNKTADGFETKRLYMYYVGTEELNPEDSNEITIGKLTLENVDQPNTTVLIQDVGDFSTVETLGYNHTPLAVSELDVVLNEQEDPSSSPSTNPSETPSEAPSESATPSQTPDGNGDGNEGSGSGSQGGNNNGGTENNGSTGSGSGSVSTEKKPASGDSSEGDNRSGNTLLNKLKTGANKSVTWAVVTLAVLVVIAIVLVKKKGKLAKKGRRSK